MTSHSAFRKPWNDNGIALSLTCTYRQIIHTFSQLNEINIFICMFSVRFYINENQSRGKNPFSCVRFTDPCMHKKRSFAWHAKFTLPCILINSFLASGEFWRPLMTFANNLDPDEAPHNVGLQLRSKLFDVQIIYQQKKMDGNNDFFENFERNKYLKKLPSRQQVNK